jgi:hypothetical protein
LVAVRSLLYNKKNTAKKVEVWGEGQRYGS